MHVGKNLLKRIINQGSSKVMLLKQIKKKFNRLGAQRLLENDFDVYDLQASRVFDINKTSLMLQSGNKSRHLYFVFHFITECVKLIFFFKYLFYSKWICQKKPNYKMDICLLLISSSFPEMIDGIVNDSQLIWQNIN